MGDERTVRIAQSCAQDPAAAVEALHDGLRQPDAVARALLLLQRVRPRRAGGGDGPALRRRAGGRLHDRRGDRPARLPRPQRRRRELRGRGLQRRDRPPRGPAPVPDPGRRGVRAGPAPQARRRRVRRRGREHLRLPAGGRPLGPRGAARPRAAAGPGEHPAGRRLGRRQPELRAHVHLPGRPFQVRRGRPRPGHHPAPVHRVQDPALRAHRRETGGHGGPSRRARRRGDQRPAGRAGVRAHPRPRRGRARPGPLRRVPRRGAHRRRELRALHPEGGA